MDTVSLAIPNVLHSIPILQLHSGDMIVDGARTLHFFDVRKPFVRLARISGVTGRIAGTFG